MFWGYLQRRDIYHKENFFFAMAHVTKGSKGSQESKYTEKSKNSEESKDFKDDLDDDGEPKVQVDTENNPSREGWFGC